MPWEEYLFFTVLGCKNISLVGDGSCDELTNNEVCNYDGGDCCLHINKMDNCSNCICYHEGLCNIEINPFVGDGFCNDETNTYECRYDGGDCCESNTSMIHCSECTCYHQETCAAGIYPSLIGDGFCNDETNNADCNYDGGDCCGSCINTDYCLHCICLGKIVGNGVPHAHVGNGFCNEETNTPECSYDGGDCCLASNLVGNGICNNQTNIPECNYDGLDCCFNVNSDLCHCQELELVGNGYCDLETNNAECNYDAGECCGPDISCKLRISGIIIWDV